MPLWESLYIVEKSQNKLEKCQGSLGNIVKEKCKYMIKKNQGLENLKIIRDIRQNISILFRERVDPWIPFEHVHDLLFNSINYGTNMWFWVIFYWLSKSWIHQYSQTFFL